MHTLETGQVLDTLNPELAACTDRVAPPQDLETEVRPLVARLRTATNDPQLDIRWNPLSYVTCPGSFDALGRPIRPRYAGRWEVIRVLGDQLAPIVVYQVRDHETEGYKPVGDWLLAFMATWDRANTHWMREQQQLMDEADRVREWEDQQDLAELTDALDRHAVEALGMKQWLGKGVQLRAPHVSPT
jgi:hypothetical protein